MRRRSFDLATGVLGPFLGLLVVFATFTVADEVRARRQNRRSSFANVASVQKILKDASLVGVAALGMTLIIIAGGIDLSAGTASALCATVTAWFLVDVTAAEYEWAVATASTALLVPAVLLCLVVCQWIAMRRRGTVLALVCSGRDDAAPLDRTARRLGWMALLSALIAGLLFVPVDDPPVRVGLAIVVGLAMGSLCGLLNGSLISLLGVVPFIVTLGTMTAFHGAGLILANNTPIRAHDATPRWIPALQRPYPVPPYLLERELLPIPHVLDTEWGRIPLLVPTGVWLMLGLAVLVWLLLRFTVFGRHVFAVGANEEAARLCGISVVRVRIAVYSLAGLFVGVAGLYQFAQLGGEGDPNAGSGKELDFIAAVVIGGGSLAGGRGSVVGTLVGACIMATIRHGCVTVGVSTAWQMVILGVIIVGAVTLDQYRQRGTS